MTLRLMISEMWDKMCGQQVAEQKPEYDKIMDKNSGGHHPDRPGGQLEVHPLGALLGTPTGKVAR